MPRTPSKIQHIVILCLIACMVIPSARVEAANSLTPEQWREDLAVLDQALRTDHENPFHTVGETEYGAMVRSLHDRIGEMSDQEIIVEMAAIVASINDGHTRLTGWYQNAAEWGFHSYPLALYWFSDGLFVRQADPEHADLVGAELLQVGDHTAAEAQTLIERIVAADNPQGELDGGSYLLICPEVLEAVGLIEAGESTPYLLEKDGRSWRPELEPLDLPWPGWERGFVPARAGWVDASDGAALPTPLWRQRLEEVAWFEYRPEEKLLYVQQNEIHDPPHERLETFYARVWEALENNEVEKLVLDLRLNGGGNNYRNKPALTMMVRADAVTQTFTVVGRRTFSACQNLVNQLSRWTDTVFVGEPTGERVNFYGDTRSTQLPNSGLAVRASWLWWQDLDPRDTRDALYPDLAAELSSADYEANRDPALEAILRFEGLIDEDTLVALLDDQGLPAVRERLHRSIQDPMYRYRNMEAMINGLGYRLMGEGHTDDAIAIFAVNVAEFPDSWNAYDSLAEAYETSGDRERALMFYEKSLSLNPTSPTGLAAVARLDGEAGTDSARRD